MIFTTPILAPFHSSCTVMVMRLDAAIFSSRWLVKFFMLIWINRCKFTLISSENNFFCYKNDFFFKNIW